MPTRLISAAVCLATPGMVFASDFSSLKFEAFVDDFGTSSSIGTLVNASQKSHVEAARKRLGFAVFFWADWCVPCKEELSLVLANRSMLAGVDLVAINVDEPSDWAKARQTLTVKGWSGESLHSWRDPGGSYFYKARPSGDLPQTVLLGPNGDIIRGFSALDGAVLATFPPLLEGARSADDRSEEVSPVEGSVALEGAKVSSRQTRFGLGMSGWYRENRLPPAPGSQERFSSLWAQSLFATAEAPFRSQRGLVRAKVTHDLLGQKLSTAKETWEDELGDSSLSILLGDREDAGGRALLTVGDETLKLADGLVLQVRHFAPSNEARRLRGLHYRHDASRWDVFASHGLVEDRLFDHSLDTSLDVTRASDPTMVTAVGGDLGVSESTRLGLAVALAETFDRTSRSTRKAPVDTEGFRHFGRVSLKSGVPRLGGTAEHLSQRVQLSIGGAFYPEASGKGAADGSGHALTSSVGLSLLERGEETTREKASSPGGRLVGLFLNGNYSRAFLQPTYTSLPDLNVDFATPVVASRREAYRVKPTLSLAPFANMKQTLDLSVISVHEAGVSADRGEEAQTWGLEQGVSAWGQKLLLTQRDFRSRTLAEKGREHVGNGTANLFTPHLTSQVTYRRIRIHETGEATSARTRSGTRFGANLGVQSGRLFEDWGNVSLSATRTHQSGEYVGLSGIDGKELTSLRVTWIHSLAQLSAAYGQEPGGVVCTAGSCRQMPPLNGLAIDAGILAAF